MCPTLTDLANTYHMRIRKANVLLFYVMNSARVQEKQLLGEHLLLATDRLHCKDTERKM